MMDPSNSLSFSGMSGRMLLGEERRQGLVRLGVVTCKDSVRGRGGWEWVGSAWPLVVWPPQRTNTTGFAFGDK